MKLVEKFKKEHNYRHHPFWPGCFGCSFFYNKGLDRTCGVFQDRIPRNVRVQLQIWKNCPLDLHTQCTTDPKAAFQYKKKHYHQNKKGADMYHLVAWKGTVFVHSEQYFTEQSYVRWLNENKNAYDDFKVIKGYEIEVFLL